MSRYIYHVHYDFLHDALSETREPPIRISPIEIPGSDINQCYTYCAS